MRTDEELNALMEDIKEIAAYLALMFLSGVVGFAVGFFSK